MFQKAQRTQAKLKLAVLGPSGSGKTYSSLRLAKGLSEKIAVVDTENNSASLYSDDFNFDVLNIKPPYTWQKYGEAIDSAVKAHYDVLVIDSISHLWAGEGGLLDKKEALDRSGKGSGFTNWATITKEHEAFKAKILNAPIHIICTMRSKQEYILVENEKGKKIPQKVGMAPVQRDAIEYEYTTVFDIGMNHFCTVSKDRTKLFDGQVFMITEETGEALKIWLEQGKPVQVETPKENTSSIKATNGQLKELLKISKENGFHPDDVKLIMKKIVNVDSSKDLTQQEFSFVFNWILNHHVSELPMLMNNELKNEDETLPF